MATSDSLHGLKLSRDQANGHQKRATMATVAIVACILQQEMGPTSPVPDALLRPYIVRHMMTFDAQLWHQGLNITCQ